MTDAPVTAFARKRPDVADLHFCCTCAIRDPRCHMSASAAGLTSGDVAQISPPSASVASAPRADGICGASLCSSTPMVETSSSAGGALSPVAGHIGHAGWQRGGTLRELG
jgi:hypothetical protein